MKKGIFILFLFSVFLMVSCQNIQTKQDLPIEQPKNEIAFGISQEQCKNAGGNWNECGSPCAGTNAEVCIQVCEAQCQCGGIAGFKCPEGYKCRLSGRIADEMGVCIHK